MANFYTDTHGERWGVMIQEKTMSCGPACVAMTEVYMKSSAQANMEAKARSVSQRYPGAFSESKGTSMSNLVDILRQDGFHCYDAYDVKPGGVWPYIYAYAKDNTPVIAHVQWGGGAAHFVLFVHVYKDDQRCVVLDPWYGLVQPAGSALATYVVGDPTGTFPPVAVGKLSGWLIITKPMS